MFETAVTHSIRVFALAYAGGATACAMFYSITAAMNLGGAREERIGAHAVNLRWYCQKYK